VILDKVNNSR